MISINVKVCEGFSVLFPNLCLLSQPQIDTFYILSNFWFFYIYCPILPSLSLVISMAVTTR